MQSCLDLNCMMLEMLFFLKKKKEDLEKEKKKQRKRNPKFKSSTNHMGHVYKTTSLLLGCQLLLQKLFHPSRTALLLPLDYNNNNN